MEIKIDKKTGIAYCDDTGLGMRFTIHPNISCSGSVTGMKNLGCWRKDDRVRRFGSFQYNIDLVSYDKNSELETELYNSCQCEACLEKRETRNR